MLFVHKSMRLLYITTIPSPYRVNFFNELGKHCDLTVLFEKPVSDERDKSWSEYTFEHFNGVLMKGKKASVNTAFCPEVVTRIRKGKYDAIICGNIATPTGILEIFYMKLFRYKYYIEADGASAKKGRGIKERFKRIIIRNAKGYFSSSEECDRYFITYGAFPERIHRYPFTSLYNKDINTSVITDNEKQKIKRELGIKEQRIIISVGRFSYKYGYGKGFDVLVNVAEHIDNSIGVYIIGDDPTEEFVRLKESKGDLLSNLHFISFLRPSELSKYYSAADVFVLLSRGEAWGLVVNEAMAHGLPVIATDKCVAAVELIDDNQNGFVVPVDDYLSVTNYLKYIFEDTNRRLDFANKSIERIKFYTIESMVDAHLKVLAKEV